MGFFASKWMLVYDEVVIRILPVLAAIALIVFLSGGLIYWRYFAAKQTSTESLTSAKVTQNENPVEVPKTLPNASLEDRVKTLEDALVETIKKVNSLRNKETDTSALDSRLNSIEASITDLKVQVSSLSQPVAAASSKSTAYIPIGAGGSWDYASFTTLSDYQISLDPANFPGYTSVVLEVIFRVVDSTSTTSVRLYNSSDGAAASSEASTKSSSFTLASSSSFQLASGVKTYVLQAKNSNGKTFYIQLARLKVNY